MILASFPNLPMFDVSLLLLSCFFLAGCTAGDDTQTHIINADLRDRIAAGDPPVILDVRSGWEYRKGHVPGAVHMPFWATFSRAGQLTVPRDQPVVVYCEHGPRASVARYALQRAGFATVLHLRGHMAGWRKAGLPIMKPAAGYDKNQ